MRNSEGQPQGRQRFGISAPPRPDGGVIAPTREKELAPPPTPEETRAANAGELAPRGITKKLLNAAKNHPVITAGATVAAIAGGIAAVEAYQGNIPGVHRSIDIPQYFDTNAIEGVIGDNNILRGVDLETIQQLPSFDNEGNPLFLLPVPPKGSVAQYTKQMSKGAAIEVNSIAEAKNQNVRNEFKLTIPKNTVVPMPIDGWIFTDHTTLNGTNGIASVSIAFIDKKSALQFVDINLNDIRAEDLAQTTSLNEKNRYGRDYQKGTFGKKGTPLFRANTEMNLQYITYPESHRIPYSFNPQTVRDTNSGEAKLPSSQ